MLRRKSKQRRPGRPPLHAKPKITLSLRITEEARQKIERGRGSLSLSEYVEKLIQET